MPPKRGRGRGAASAAGAPGQRGAGSGALSADAGDKDNAGPAASNFEIQHTNLESQVSPNSSPASAPTETPASTPARAPVQRLDSLGGGAANLRGGTRGARAGAGTSRFRPKAVRRGVEEREKAAREEAERKAARDKDAAALARLESGGRGRSRGRGDGFRGRGGRGRGDAMGVGRLDRSTSGASGPFSEAPSAPDRRPGLFAPGNVTKRDGSGGSILRIGGTSGGPKIKAESGVSQYTSGGGGTGTKIKAEFPEPDYPEEQDDGERAAPRINIEQINLVTDDEEEEEDDVVSYGKKGKGKSSSSSKGGLRPVRLAREEHKERVTMVNTEPAAAPLPKDTEEHSNETGGMFVESDEEAELTRRKAIERVRDADAKKFSNVWGKEADDAPHIKYDPDEPPKESITLANAMEIDSSETTPAPAATVNSEMPSEQPAAKPHQMHASPETKHKGKRRISSTKDKKPVLQTEEDKAEYQRHLEDVHILAQELGGLQTAMASENADADGDVNMDAQQVKDNKEGRLYLFQFPPILPPLYNPVKKEEPVDEDVQMSNVTPVAAHSATDLTKPDNEQEEVIIKNEPGAFAAPADPFTEAGFIGKLVVRQSGKVELDWGGTSLELGKGANFDFLTTTMLVEQPSQAIADPASGYADDGRDGSRGSGTGMGRVMGKFVATPDWSALFEKRR
ncbi:MAG: hypothetical protein M1818_001204 [Claussenomyces sp. TS43310]|nr:MAG: hypothetical protein M1818_001204 [Claussenomyces sp. TS43310]